MRLRSDFRDYYDAMQRMDIEPKPLYVRKQTKEFIKDGDKARKQELTPLVEVFNGMPSTRGDLGYVRRVLGFCGKLYPFYLGWDSEVLKQKPRCLMDIQEVQYHLSTVSSEEKSYYNWRDYKQEISNIETRRTYYGLRAFSLHGWNDFIQKEGRLLKGDYTDLFRLIKAPVFLFHSSSQGNHSGYTLRCNPSLKDIGWFRQMSLSTAWQEIDQYLGNQMVVQEDPAPLSDELRRDAHGFDDHSFKQMSPGAKKQRRKTNKDKKRNQ
jgi:hypothetical protein